MEATTLPWLDAVVGTIAGTAIGLLVVVNGLFVINVIVGRNHRFVDRWTRTLLLTDAALLFAAIGAPAAAIAIKLGARGVTIVASAPAKLMLVK